MYHIQSEASEADYQFHRLGIQQIQLDNANGIATKFGSSSLQEPRQTKHLVEVVLLEYSIPPPTVAWVSTIPYEYNLRYARCSFHHFFRHLVYRI